MIAVIGATGTTGGAALRALAARGVPARALVRPAPARRRGGPPARSRPLADPGALPGVQVVPGDATDPAALRAALTGATGVLLAMGNGPRQREAELAVVAQAAAAGVGHLVKVSAPVVGPDVPVAVARLHHEVEQAVVAAGLDHTFLRPYAFLQNLLAQAPVIAATGAFTGTTGGAPLNLVDARDVADAAVLALTTGRTRGRAVVCTGAEAVTQAEVARRLTARGRPTRYVDVRPAAYRSELRGAGLPPWLVEHLAEIQALAVARPEAPDPALARLLGRAPRTLDAFLAEHLDAFRTPGGWRRHAVALPVRAARLRARLAR